MDKKRALFICTHNSCHSQIAEGLLNSFHGNSYDFYKHHSKTMNDFKGEEFDVVVKVCDNAREACPFFP